MAADAHGAGLGMECVSTEPVGGKGREGRAGCRHIRALADRELGLMGGELGGAFRRETAAADLLVFSCLRVNACLDAVAPAFPALFDGRHK